MSVKFKLRVNTRTLVIPFGNMRLRLRFRRALQSVTLVLLIIYSTKKKHSIQREQKDVAIPFVVTLCLGKLVIIKMIVINRYVMLNLNLI